MEKVVLQTEHRNVIGKQVNALRRAGKLPAVIYGHNFEPTPIVLNEKEATKALSGLTSSSLVTLVLDGTEHASLVRDRQRDYIHNRLIHIDFQVVSLTEKIRAKVSVEITGTSPAVKDFNGVVLTGLDEVEVECLPQYLPERLIVDISPLKKIGDGIYVRDISFDENVELLEDVDEMIVMVTASTEEEAVVAGEGAEAEPEVIEKGKKEEEVED
jgi:large subunit ribosomal protein L25